MTRPKHKRRKAQKERKPKAPAGIRGAGAMGAQRVLTNELPGRQLDFRWETVKGEPAAPLDGAPRWRVSGVVVVDGIERMWEAAVVDLSERVDGGQFAVGLVTAGRLWILAPADRGDEHRPAKPNAPALACHTGGVAHALETVCRASQAGNRL